MMALKNNKKNIETNAYGICINPQHILSSFLKNFKELNTQEQTNIYFVAHFINYFSKLRGKLFIEK